MLSVPPAMVVKHQTQVPRRVCSTNYAPDVRIAVHACFIPWSRSVDFNPDDDKQDNGAHVYVTYVTILEKSGAISRVNVGDCDQDFAEF